MHPSSYKKLLTSLIFLLLVSLFTISSQSLGDYRSVASGYWNSKSSWQYFDGNSWVAATNYPGEIDGTGAITINTGHEIDVANLSYTETIYVPSYTLGSTTITVNTTPKSFGSLFIQNGATLHIIADITALLKTKEIITQLFFESYFLLHRFINYRHNHFFHYIISC